MSGRPVTLVVAAVAVLLVALSPLAPRPLQAADTRRDGSLDAVLGEVPPGFFDGFPDAPQSGALVVEVYTGGAGDRKGLREGDVVVEFHGERVHNPWDLAGQIRRRGEGALVSVTVWREGKREWLGIASLSGREWVTVLDDEVSALQEEVATLHDEIAALRGDLAAVRKELAAATP